MRIPILILGFKGLRLQEGMTNIPDRLLLKHTKNNRYNVCNSNSQGDEQISLTNKFQQNLMNVPNYYKHSTYQNRKK